MSMDFELKLDGKTMSRFLLHYNYTKATGLFGILLGIAGSSIYKMEYVECKPACGLDCDCGFVFDCSAAYSCEKRKTPDGTGRNADSSVLPY